MSKRKIYKNAVFLTFADAATKGATALLGLLIARFMGPEGYGPYAIASVVGGLFMMITSLGFEEEFTRRGGKDPARIQSALTLDFKAVSIACALAFLALGGFLSFGLYSKETIRLTVLMTLALIAARFHLPFRHLCLLLGRSRVTAFIQGTGTALMLALTVMMIFKKASLTALVGAQGGATILVLAVWLVWYKRRVILAPMDIKENRGVIEFARSALPFAVTNLVWVGYFNAGPFLLSLVRAEVEVGVYAAVFRIIAITYILGYSLANTFTPLLFRFQAENKGDFHKYAVHLVQILACVGVPVGLIFFMYSGSLVHFIIGPRFDSGLPVMKILSLSIIFRFFNFGLSEILTTSGRQRQRVLLEIFMLALHVMAALFLIESRGPTGLALAVLVSELVLFGGSLLLLWRPVFFPRSMDVSLNGGKPA